MRLFVDLLTPFDNRGRPDLGRLRAHVQWLSLRGVDGFVVTGAAGELPYLSAREREALHRIAIDAADGRPVYPCTWDPSPTTIAYLTDAARSLGAAGVILPPPVFYTLDDEALQRWYVEVTQRAELPVIGLHDPAHFPSPISATLYARLRHEQVLAGLMDHSLDLFRLSRLSTADPNTIFASGDRILAMATRIPRLCGCISTLANAWPTLCDRIYKGREVQLEAALIERINQIRRAGGVRALKAHLSMGCRTPLVPPSATMLRGIEETEYGSK